MSGSSGVDRVRERIVETAGELFTSRGINATGVDLICESAGVSKRSMYQRFASKDELVAVYLADMVESLRKEYLPDDEAVLTPVERILAVFAAAQRGSRDEYFRGCRLLNASAELADPEHPGRLIAAGGKLDIQAYFAEQAAEAGARDPGALAEHLAILFDGGFSYALVRRTTMPIGVLAAARALIETHLAEVPPPAGR
ncbi:TetR/AcrR family transcriptional regulator [Streptomyces polygonati]|uniref:TetR/AcrR family transcriptional regulator n=1 Tax=Streptomyces polygonati TaxID=1617087 RepID=A0ABV8HK63_9ACTN